jgi:hypothetical protein
MTEHVDAAELLADARRKQQRVRAVARRAHAKLGVEDRSSPTYLTDGLTAEEIERDTASIHKVLAVWRRIGKTSPSPLTLPSGKTIIPKKSATNERGRIEYAVTRPRSRRGVRM